MLEDFVSDLKKTLSERLEADRDALESTSGGDSHDLIRGRIAGFKQAIIDITELLERYAEPESTPEALEHYPAEPRGRFGRRAA